MPHLRLAHHWIYCLLISLAVFEKEDMPRSRIGHVFALCSIVAYAGIGRLSRSSDVSEHYVAGCRVPALFNGVAMAADWMSAASFLVLAGGLYLFGFDVLGDIVGWTGGFCLVALLVAPYLNKFGQYMLPDFLVARDGGGTEKIRCVWLLSLPPSSHRSPTSQLRSMRSA